MLFLWDTSLTGHKRQRTRPPHVQPLPRSQSYSWVTKCTRTVVQSAILIVVFCLQLLWWWHSSSVGRPSTHSACWQCTRAATIRTALCFSPCTKRWPTPPACSTTCPPLWTRCCTTSCHTSSARRSRYGPSDSLTYPSNCVFTSPTVICPISLPVSSYPL